MKSDIDETLFEITFNIEGKIYKRHKYKVNAIEDAIEELIKHMNCYDDVEVSILECERV